MANKRILLRRDTRENWSLNNPILECGEVGVILEGAAHSTLKIGDGVTRWNDLPEFQRTEGSIEEILTNYYNKAEIDDQISTKQETLISGTNIKTINGESLLGEGDILMGSIDIEDTGLEIVDHEYYIYKNKPITIEALENNTEICFVGTTSCNYEYSIDENEWTPLVNDGNKRYIEINKGQTISFRGNVGTLTTSKKAGRFYIKGKCNVKGNVMSLLYNNDFADKIDLTGKQEAFSNLFAECKTLLNARKLILPATILAEYCYNYMFMGCTNLTTAPELPATTLANYCYSYMFNGCTNLTTASELPATTLTDYCYSNMFSGCTSLTIAPELPATILTYYCYNRMFNGCSNLSYIKMLANDISASYCLNNWVNGVSSTGTFVKDVNTSIPVGVSGIPADWNIKTVGIKWYDITINGVQYHADANSTWSSWLTSKHNTDNFYSDNNGYIYNSSGDSKLTIDGTTYVSIYDNVINNNNYVLVLDESDSMNFFINNIEYKVDSNMTWEDWLNSDYNTDGFMRSGLGSTASISNADGDMQVYMSDLSYISIDSNIEHGHEYILAYKYDENGTDLQPIMIGDNLYYLPHGENWTWEDWVNSEYNTGGFGRAFGGGLGDSMVCDANENYIAYKHEEGYSEVWMSYGVFDLGTVYYLLNRETGEIVKKPQFTIDGVKYKADPNMTWEDWVNSDYNTGGFYKQGLGGGGIYSPEGYQLNYYIDGTPSMLFSDGIINDGDVVVLLNDNGEVLISFTIDGVKYKADPNMTWGDWVNSNYNTDGFTTGGLLGQSSIYNADVTKEVGLYVAQNPLPYVVYTTDNIIQNEKYVLIEY